jgi:hypothetical protein
MLLQQAVAAVVVGHRWCLWALLAAQINGYQLCALCAAHFEPGDALRSG